MWSSYNEKIGPTDFVETIKGLNDIKKEVEDVEIKTEMLLEEWDLPSIKRENDLEWIQPLCSDVTSKNSTKGIDEKKNSEKTVRNDHNIKKLNDVEMEVGAVGIKTEILHEECDLPSIKNEDDSEWIQQPSCSNETFKNSTKKNSDIKEYSCLGSEKVTMDVYHLSKICEDKEVLLNSLREWHLIPQDGDYLCPRCGGQFTLCKDASRVDGWRWRCPNYSSVRKQKRRRCEYTRQFRYGTIFARTKLSVFQVLAFVNMWLANVSLKLICEQLKISPSSAINWASFCREVLLETFFNNPQKLGGTGKIVEIFISKFGSRKYHRGHHVEGQWVVGGYERGSGRIFTVTVDQQNTDTLLPIIEEWIEKGTTIHSDCWKAYDSLSKKGYHHLTVNHSISFKDPETSVHTKNIESSWRYAKALNPSSGRKKDPIPRNLARYIFYKKCDEFNLNQTVEFFKLAGQLYNPLKLNNKDSIHVANEDERKELEEEF